MGLLGKVFGRQGEKQTDIRKTLFGDLPPEEWPPQATAGVFPWSAFVTARDHLQAGNRDAAMACWREVLGKPGLEPRHYMQAWHFLRQHGEKPPAEQGKLLLGVVVEVMLGQGLDLLAAYSDYSARYYNFSGAGVVWDHPDASLDRGMDGLFEASKQAVERIRPWEGARPEPPALGHARLSFLTPSGIHFGEGPMAALAGDPIGGPVLHAAATLMKQMIAKAGQP